MVDICTWLLGPAAGSGQKRPLCSSLVRLLTPDADMVREKRGPRWSDRAILLRRSVRFLADGRA
jgi:hypothetical protein